MTFEHPGRASRTTDRNPEAEVRAGCSTDNAARRHGVPGAAPQQHKSLKRGAAPTALIFIPIHFHSR